MRNILIIVACAAVVLLGALAVVFGGELFGGGRDPGDRASASARAGDEANRDADDDREDAEADPARSARAGDTSIGDAKAAMNAELPARLAEAARLVNAAGPTRIDELTMMTSATAAGNRIVYRYEIARRLTPQQEASFRELATSTNRGVLCTREEARTLLGMGGEVEYVYFDPTGRRLFSTPITSC